MHKREDLSFSGILYALALLVLAYQVGMGLVEFGQNSLAALQFPYPLDYSEGPILDQVLHLARFENIYRNDVSIPPYTLSNNPPVFQLLQLPFAWLFGPAFWYGRLISLLSAILTAGLIGWTVYYLTGEWIAAGIAGLLLFTFPYILEGSGLDQGGLLAMALSWAGLSLILRASGRKRSLVLAILFHTAAVFTQPSFGLAAPITMVIWLGIQRRFRQAAGYALGLVSACLVLFLGMNWATAGGFYFNLVTVGVSAFSYVPLVEQGVQLFTHGWLLIFFAVGFLVIERWWYPTRSWSLVLPYFLSASLAMVVSGGASSGGNNLYEVTAALCLAAGAVIAWPGRNSWIKTGLILLLAVQVSWLVAWARDDYVPNVTARVRSATEIARMASIVKDAPGPILSDEFMGLSPLVGRPIYFQPKEFSRLQYAGLWDQTPLVDAIRRGEFAAILLYEPTSGTPMIVSRWTPQMRDAVWKSYQLKSTLAGTWIYTPKK